MSEHRVPMLGASWRRLEDPARSRDPRVRALVGALAGLPSPAPSAEFRAELRAQLVAIAPRVISESRESATTFVDIAAAEAPARRTSAVDAGPRHTDSVIARLRGIRFGRPLAIVASVVTAFALLLGGAVVMARNALPGDALYGLKRASESFELALDSSPTAKAKDYLKFAGIRVDEVQGLIARAHGNVDAHTAGLITSTLASSDSDVRSASALLGAQAVKTRSATPLAIITAWAPSQLTRLQAAAAAMPAGTLRARTDSSAAVVDAAVARAHQLAPSISAGCANTSVTDALGPLPTAGCVTLPTVPSTQPSAHPTISRSGGAVTSNSVGAPGGGTIVPNGSGSPAGSGSGGASSSAHGIPLPSIPLPSVPTSLPVNVCTGGVGVGVTLGPIVIGLGSCPPHP